MNQDEEKSLTDIAALMRERQKFEAWLAALEARRGSTPEHVFERVRADYEARLDRVLSDLLSHRDALELRVRDLGDRLSALEASERQRRDQRAEMELRAAVGELVDADFAQAAREVETAIARALAEKGEVKSALEATSELLLGVTMPKPMSPISAAPAVPAPVHAPAAEPAESEPARITAARHATQAVPAPRDTTAPAAAAPAPSAAHPAPAPAPQAAAAQPSVPRPRPSAPVRLEDVARAESAPPAAAAAPPVAPARREEPPAAEVPPMVEPPFGAPSHAGDGQRASGNSFDELAFLNSIVGEERKSAARSAPPPPAAPQPPVRPSGPGTNELGLMREDSMGADSLRASRATGMMPDMTGIVQDESLGSSLVSRVDVPHDEHEDTDVPLASNVTGNHPIVLRPAGDSAQHKTLRCNECGAMNYPTEWYCERCGAELAAL